MITESALLTWPTTIAKSRLVAVGRLDEDCIPGQRARVTRSGGAYYSKRYTAYREQLGWTIKQSLRRLPSEPDADSSYGVRVAFARATRQRTDVDNVLKTVLDAATGIVWRDDSQVLEATIRKLGVQRDDPYLEFVLYTVPPVEQSVGICLSCQKPIKGWFPSVRAVTCGGACAEALRLQNRAKRKRTCGKCSRTFVVSAVAVKGAFCESCRKGPRTCDQCGGKFVIARSKAARQHRQFCSRECALLWWRTRPAKGRTVPCPKCGAPKAERYKASLCRACRMEARGDGNAANYWRFRVPVT